MRKLLSNQSGNLAIAMLLAVVGLMSGISMATIALKDTQSFLWEFESIQGLHMLRAEAYRGQAVLERNSDMAGVYYTSVRSVPVTGSHIRRTFTAQSRIYKEKSEQTDVVEIQGGDGATGSLGEGREHYKIDSLVEAKRGVGQAAYYGASKSPVRKYSELTIIQTSFSEFMYFTDNDSSPNNTNVYFYGYDVMTGKVHSNTDIRIKQAGGGNNNGWPTFLNLVTTAGNIISTPSNYPLNDVFQGGLVEEYDGYEFPPEANELRNRGTRLGQGGGDGNIYLVEVERGGFAYHHGIITQARRVSKIVYDEYPPPGDSLWTNHFDVPDTIWTPAGGGTSMGRPFFVDGDLWIKGNFQGYQTWGSSGDMRLIGDIKLRHTNLGDNPIDNSTDVVGLISEKSVYVAYGYADPDDSTRIHTNMGEDSLYDDPAGGGIFIYAAVAALGDGGNNSFNDGVFTFEYMHPHPSTPALNVILEYDDGTQEIVTFDFIDIHRRRYPPTGSQPWPTPELGQQRLDLPWYNPLWPEAQPYLERGTINVWGAIAQRRRGFVHRSHNDGEYPSNSGVWDIDIDKCGYPTNPVQIIDPVFGPIGLIARNYPGAAGGGVGYKKNYNYDNRLLQVTPLLYPKVRLKGGKNPMNQGDWNIRKPVRSLV